VGALGSPGKPWEALGSPGKPWEALGSTNLVSALEGGSFVKGVTALE